MSNGKVASVRSGLGEAPAVKDDSTEQAPSTISMDFDQALAKYGSAKAKLEAGVAVSNAIRMVLEPAFTPDQRELRQLLAVKLRALAASVEGINSTRPATAGEIQREVARLGDIAGAME